MSNATKSLEIRSATSDVKSQGRSLQGYAALFNTRANIDSFVETIKPGAFAASLASGRDVIALVDHNPAQVLGRTKSGTLRLAEDSRGLRFSVDLPDTQAARDVLALAARGDLGGMSFGFTATDEAWQSDVRELHAVVLHEISVVSAWAAYAGTTVTARSGAEGFTRRNLALAYLQTINER